jgi:phage tail sheath protein FI
LPVTPITPGVYVQEISSGARAITGVATSIAAFVGRTLSSPVNQPIPLSTYADYELAFGSLAADLPMSYAMRDYYLNGGDQAIVVRLRGPTKAGNPAVCGRGPPGWRPH